MKMMERFVIEILGKSLAFQSIQYNDLSECCVVGKPAGALCILSKRRGTFWY